MTDDEASGFVTRYKSVWRGGPSVAVLREEFAEMDAGTLGTALVRLRRDLDDAPGVARIWREYRSLDTPANDPLPEPDCGACAGDGWVTRGYVVDGRPYRGVVPCAVCGARRGTPHIWAEVVEGSATLRAVNALRLGR